MPEDKKKNKESRKKSSSGKESESEGPAYMPRAKPKLTPDEKHALDLRRDKKRRTPHFRRQEWFRYKRLGESWRRPRGLHSKARKNLKYRPPKVSKGFMGPKGARGKHPSGFQEVMVYNHRDLEGLDPGKQAVRIGHSVGYLKRIYIAIRADEMGIRILNFNSQAHKDLLEEARKRGIELPEQEGSA